VLKIRGVRAQGSWDRKVSEEITEGLKGETQTTIKEEKTHERILLGETQAVLDKAVWKLIHVIR